jgi:hypothetical protein
MKRTLFRRNFMTVRSRIRSMAALIEFVIGGGLAIFFHSVLHKEDAAYTIFGTGLLLSLATYLVREDVAKVRETMLREYRSWHEFPAVIATIQDPECILKAREMMDSMKKNLAQLQRGYIPMNETEFLMEAAKVTDATKVSVRSINPLTPGWNERAGFIRYYDSNKRAVSRGVKVMRTFVLRRERMGEQDVQSLLKKHLENGIDVRVAFRDELVSSGDTGWLRESSFNFAVYDGKVAVDVFPTPGTYYGVKTTNPAEVAKFIRVADLVEHAAHTVVIREDVACVDGSP